jgi:Flp pilus assembly protein TadG
MPARAGAAYGLRDRPGILFYCGGKYYLGGQERRSILGDGVSRASSIVFGAGGTGIHHNERCLAGHGGHGQPPEFLNNHYGSGLQQVSGHDWERAQMQQLRPHAYGSDTRNRSGGADLCIAAGRCNLHRGASGAIVNLQGVAVTQFAVSSPGFDEGNGLMRLAHILGIRTTFLGGEDGAIAIETSLGFMLLMTMMLGIVECCMMGYTYASQEDAAREGVRYAIVHGVDSTTCSGPGTGTGSACTDSTAANVSSAVTTFASSFCGNLSSMVVTVTYPDGTSTANSRVQVAISYTYQSLFHFPGASQHLQVSSQGRILY